MRFKSYKVSTGGFYSEGFGNQDRLMIAKVQG